MTSLYGKLIGQATREYEVQTSALNTNKDAINRFGDEIRKFDLVPHVRPLPDSKVLFIAHCVRGRDHATVLKALSSAGYTVGKAEKLPQQFQNDYVIWHVPVSSRSLSFDLVFYTMVDVS